MKVSMLRVTNETPSSTLMKVNYGSVVRRDSRPYLFCFLTTLESENGTGTHVVYFGIPEDSQSHQFQFLSCPADEFDRTFTITDGDSDAELESLMSTIFEAMSKQLKTTKV